MKQLLLSTALVASFFGPARLNAQAPAPAPAQPAVTEASKPNDYGDGKSWLCRPGRKGDACDVDMTATVVAANGTLTRETWAPDPKAPIDCFYVYPTVSTDPGDHSDMTPDAAETNVVMQQFARFAAKCRVFAPSYRQLTLAGLRKSLAGPRLELDHGVGYDDVRDAWNSYLKNDNQGRGVVLIGHSQGSFVLIRLIHDEVDGKPIQKQLVSAILLGTTVSVEKGKDVGGSFNTVPICRKPAQAGCVVTYASFRSTIPPPANTRFGKTDQPGLVTACTNPVTLGEGSSELRSYLSTAGRTITGTAAPKAWAGADKSIDTPWVSVPGLITAKCATNENATYLEITIHGDPADPRIDDITGDLGTPPRVATDWGLHLIDVNLAMGNLVDLVGVQAKAYAAKKR
ncbi:MAG: DUF3089 domain-containing protein [Vicinamibacterales bacterium]